MAFEMPNGGVFPFYEIKTWKFLRYADSDGTALAALQIVWVLFVVAFTVIMGNEMYREGCSCSKQGYWGKTRWRVLDLINYCFFYGAIIVFIANEAYRHKKGHDWKDIYQFRSFRKLQYFFLSETYILAFNGFLSFFKLFKYFSVNRRLKFFFTMLGKAGQDLLMFILVLIIFFLGFGFCGYMIFSSDVDDYRSMVYAFSNMVRFMVGDIDYSSLQVSSRTWGSVYYVLWSVLMLLILTNVFIAILSQAYSETADELSDEDKLSFGFLGMRGAVLRLQQMVRNVTKLGIDTLDADGDGQLDAQELAAKTGWTIEAAQQFIDQHDQDHNGKLSQKEWETLAQEMEQNVKPVRNSRVSLLGMANPRVSLLGMANPRRSSLFKGGAGVASGSMPLRPLHDKMTSIEELLKAQLRQSKTGTKALKEIETRHKCIFFFFFFTLSLPIKDFDPSSFVFFFFFE
ncbi:hypothetical protein RFI_23534 [Reticulomyxa filosa]|uniref:EF-hand domain-containing protein n=1 Tax=Reticulomyxa filosa TaxID=46433 RepID=X6MK54_RETFI|nr:hypothetical protein RFI_23534 [Reticulomyxa filosa]|eukprot:ETO13837.1 hypothetical protein RFI_23534 [Reticulomyxa filosa]